VKVIVGDPNVEERRREKWGREGGFGERKRKAVAKYANKQTKKKKKARGQ
jgi:hypothetical protein